jgi:hypothetical protein
MENNSNSIEDIRTIRRIMEESSRFLSLSGLSGVFAGVFAITGALVAYFLILNSGNIHYDGSFKNLAVKDIATIRWQLIADAVIVLVLAILSAFYLSLRKAKHAGKTFWTPVSKRLLINLLIPLITGGIFIVILMVQNHIRLIVPGMLIFYGLSLVSAGKFTYNEIFYLGILEIFIGLISAIFPDQSLFFWIFGFGILHIIYGLLMYRKYES